MSFHSADPFRKSTRTQGAVLLRDLNTVYQILKAPVAFTHILQLASVRTNLKEIHEYMVKIQ
jgi:hypothetical protein